MDGVSAGLLSEDSEADTKERARADNRANNRINTMISGASAGAEAVALAGVITTSRRGIGTRLSPSVPTGR